MMPGLLFENVLSWTIQVLVIGSVGALLPALFRIRNPRSQLVYCHLLLALCPLLPIIQPWEEQGVASTASAAPMEAAVALENVTIEATPASPIPWGSVLFGILALGGAARLTWLLVGCIRITRYRHSATPLYPLPVSVATARTLTGSDALFCTSAQIASPVTFGVFEPVVLLPAAFRSMGTEAQTAILCHELLHVRRRDWLVTLIEELYGSLLWFHPAVWWLLSQARLAREQLVDAEVVRLTKESEPYINALLEIAGRHPVLDLAPAPLFLRRRHLARRMHSLLTEVSMSKRQLFASYASIALIVGAASWLALVSFPLYIEAETLPPLQEGETGFVVTIPPLEYPSRAFEGGFEGEVVVELAVSADGKITDSRVLSGPEDLREIGLRSAVSRWYTVTSARTIQVIVDFTESPSARRAGEIVFDDAGRVVPRQPRTVGSVNILGLDAVDRSRLEPRLNAFLGQPLNQRAIKEAVNAAGIDEPYVSGIQGRGGPDNSASLTLRFGEAAAEFRERLAEHRNMRRSPAFPPAPRTTTRSGVPVELASQVPLVYPPRAREARLSGLVVLEATIRPDGTVSTVSVLRGHPLLNPAAAEAVSQWRYQPTGRSGDIVARVTVPFSFQPEDDEDPNKQ